MAALSRSLLSPSMASSLQTAFGRTATWQSILPPPPTSASLWRSRVELRSLTRGSDLEAPRRVQGSAILADEPLMSDTWRDVEATAGGVGPAPADALEAERNGTAGRDSHAESLASEQLVFTNITLPPGTNSKVKRAEFVKSSAEVSQCPNDTRPEFAVIGRSNVGKSSLINMLVNRRDLAQTSKKPGKTQLINHFLINGSWYLVDLPGYGYAKVPQVKRTIWNEFTKEYFLQRKTLVAVLLLVDATIPPQQSDFECADWFGQNQIPITIVFTKCDRRKKPKNGGKPPHENVKAFIEELKTYYAELPPWIMTSSENGMGKDGLLTHVAQLRNYWQT